MHYLVFTKRQLQVQHKLNQSGVTPSTVGITKLYDQGKNLEVCMIQGETDQVYEAFADLQLRPDLLVTQVLSGEMELANSSVNTWLWRQFSRINIQAPSTPSH